MDRREEMKLAIQTVIRALMDRVMDNVLRKDPFISENHEANKPLYAALVPNEIFKGSHFERRFTTPFGKAWEVLALTVARKAGRKAETGMVITGDIRQERLRRIQERLDVLEHGKDELGRRVKPDWQSEIEYVFAGGGELLPATVITDLYVESPDGKERFAFELKAPLPNSDQTKVSKEKMLKLYAMEPIPVTAAYYALPYNPYGKKEEYKWSFPFRWFDMINDSVVLIGDEFWDKVGGSGTYESFIEALNELGPEYKERIYREFLQIDPPEGALESFRVREEKGTYDDDSPSSLFDGQNGDKKNPVTDE